MPTFILLFQCQDKKGIVAKVSDFIFRQAGNIITADQYTTDPQAGYFFMRLEFSIEGAQVNKDALSAALAPVAREFGAEYKIYAKDERLRMGILVSRPDHCLVDLLYLWKSGELRAEVPFIASNYTGHKELAQQYKIPFHFIPATIEDRREQELLILTSEKSDFLVLARYMLQLSPQFLRAYTKDIINIHHGFLPSFKGAHPYLQALESGVKVIGATAHFVTEKLDEGPIIAQAVEQVSHRDDLAALVRKGKNLEQRALASAIHSYLDYRVIRHQNKTIVF